MALPGLAVARNAGSDQETVEQRAIHLLARPEVTQALDALASQWRAGSPGLLPETYQRLPQSLREIALLVALQVVNDDPRRPQVVEISSAPHTRHGVPVPGSRWGINNPDTLYYVVPLESGSRYVLTGTRRGHGPSDINFTVQQTDVWRAAGNLGFADLHVSPTGRYRIAIDADHAPGRPNHLQIRDGATQLVIRDTLADWASEDPDRVTVTRVAGPPARRPLSEPELARRLIARLHGVIAHSVYDLQPPIFRLPANVLPQPGAIADKPGFLVTQRNALGHFRLAEDEALVAKVNPGGAGYATFPVTDVWGVSPDSEHHQNSLNNRQARSDPDGGYTVVLSHRDPGVANWIDPAGLHEGIIMVRWQRLDPARTGDRGPSVSAQVVRFDDLAKVLPTTIDRVDPGQREAQAKARAEAFRRRFGGVSPSRSKGGRRDLDPARNPGGNRRGQYGDKSGKLPRGSIPGDDRLPEKRAAAPRETARNG